MNPNFQKEMASESRFYKFVCLGIYYFFVFYVKSNQIGKEVREITRFVDSELVIDFGELRCVWILWP